MVTASQVTGPRPFVLVRDVDETGVSGTGVVAEGALFSDGSVALRWTSAFPTSVVFHDRGLESVKAVHGHNGKTRIVFTDESSTYIAGLENPPITWRELADRLKVELAEASTFVRMLLDLDRCPHGRHEGDVCSSCGGPSKGNPIMVGSANRDGYTAADRQIGWNLSARPIVVPERQAKAKVASWEPEGPR